MHESHGAILATLVAENRTMPPAMMPTQDDLGNFLFRCVRLQEKYCSVLYLISEDLSLNPAPLGPILNDPELRKDPELTQCLDFPDHLLISHVLIGPVL